MHQFGSVFSNLPRQIQGSLPPSNQIVMTTSRQFSIEAACLLGLNALSIMGAVALLCLELGTAHGATEPLRGSLSLDGTREIATTPVRAANSSASAVDFRYSPPEWQTAICLPDDPQ
jgi:hypothetical protein